MKPPIVSSVMTMLLISLTLDEIIIGSFPIRESDLRIKLL